MLKFLDNILVTENMAFLKSKNYNIYKNLRPRMQMDHYFL